jgi:hypothetical protein
MTAAPPLAVALEPQPGADGLTEPGGEDVDAEEADPEDGELRAERGPGRDGPDEHELAQPAHDLLHHVAGHRRHQVDEAHTGEGLPEVVEGDASQREVEGGRSEEQPHDPAGAHGAGCFTGTPRRGR